MNNKQKIRLGRIAFTKTKKLNSLIQKLENTTIGSINEDIMVLQTQIQALANLFDITFDTNGNIVSEGYTNHFHEVEDSTITDTEDGSGTEVSSTKPTTGIKNQ